MKKNLLKLIALLVLFTVPLCLFAGGGQEGSEGGTAAADAAFDFKAYSGSDGQSGRQIMDSVTNTVLAEGMAADITMALINKNGDQRVREMSIKSKEDGDLNKTIMHFSSPADVKGTGFLMTELSNGDTDMWLYLPELKKVRKIVSSSKNDSFMGSDISYSDMEDKPLDDYTYERFEDETVENEDCYVLQALSANDSVIDETGYRKMIYWISKVKMIPVQTVFFDANDTYFKHMRMQNIQKISDTWIPAYIEVEDVKKKHKTVMEIKNIELDTNPDDSYFTQQYLKRGN